MHREILKMIATTMQWLSGSSRVHQIRFLPGLRGPTGGAYDVPSDPLVGWEGGPHSSPLSLTFAPVFFWPSYLFTSNYSDILLLKFDYGIYIAYLQVKLYNY